MAFPGIYGQNIQPSFEFPKCTKPPLEKGVNQRMEGRSRKMKAESAYHERLAGKADFAGCPHSALTAFLGDRPS